MTVDLDELMRLRAAADAADQSLWSTRVVARGAFYDAAHTALPELVRELKELRAWKDSAEFEIACGKAALAANEEHVRAKIELRAEVERLKIEAARRDADDKHDAQMRAAAFRSTEHLFRELREELTTLAEDMDSRGYVPSSRQIRALLAKVKS